MIDTLRQKSSLIYSVRYQGAKVSIIEYNFSIFGVEGVHRVTPAPFFDIYRIDPFNYKDQVANRLPTESFFVMHVSHCLR